MVSSDFKRRNMSIRAQAEKFPERGNAKKDRKVAKQTKKWHIKFLSTISVSCMKIQGGTAPLPTPMYDSIMFFIKLFH